MKNAMHIMAAALLVCFPLLATAQPDLSALQSALDGIEEGAWVKVSRDSSTFESVWTPEALRPDGSRNPAANPRLLISSLGGFAWDSRRGNIILHGGGLDYAGNEVYYWSGETREWSRASLPSQNTDNACLVGNGANDAPVAMAVFDGLVYLPRSDRLLSLGGRSVNQVNFYCTTVNRGNISTSQVTGPYMFHPGRADGDRVGGSTGSGANPNTTGGQMWQNRQTFDTASAGEPKATINVLSAYADENGRDVVYFTASDQFTDDFDLFKYTVNSVDDARSDGIDKVGIRLNTSGNVLFFGKGEHAAGAYDPGRKLFVFTYAIDNDPTTRRSGTKPIVFYDLSSGGGANNNDQVVSQFAGDNDAFLRVFEDRKGFAIDFDQVAKRFVLWHGGGAVWELTPPPLPTADGWTIVRSDAPNSSQLPPSAGEVGGVWGRWKYISQLKAFMALTDERRGEVWLYKPRTGGVVAEPPLFSDHFER